MQDYILTIDQGTTSTRAIIFDKFGKKIAAKQMEFKQITPESGWVLHNPDEIYLTVLEVIKSVVNECHLTYNDLKCIGITNQRETTVIWDKDNYEPVYPAICWQSRQSSAICDELIKGGYLNLIHEKTGLYINPYFSASKIKWIFDNVKGVKEKALENKLLCGTIDSYLLYRLSRGESFKTDITNASRTMLFNIHEECWDQELLDLFKIPKTMLPEVCECSDDFGYAYLDDVKVPITAMIGDQHASLFGHTAFNKGDCKLTYGTGAFMLLNTANEPINSKQGLLTTIGYKLNGKTTYALEGSVFVAGSAVQWLRDGLKIIKASAETEEYATLVKDSLGVYFVPAFVGMGTPYWDNEARGAIFGLSRGTTKEHIIRATLEGICYEAYDVLDAMEKDLGTDLKTISVDGGASANNFLVQFESDITNLRLLRPTELETTALGACYLAGLKVGFFKDLEEIKKLHEIESMFLPTIDQSLRKELTDGWKVAVKACRMFKH